MAATGPEAAAGTLLPADPQSELADPGTTEHHKILVEIFLSAHRKTALDDIRARFSEIGIRKVRPQFFRSGHPPQNIAIGRAVSAEAARLAIALALQYNDGIGLLVPEERLAHRYIAIGTSIFDESFQIPVSPEDLKRLQDPALSTAQFHRLYRALAPPVRRLSDALAAALAAAPPGTPLDTEAA